MIARPLLAAALAAAAVVFTAPASASGYLAVPGSHVVAPLPVRGHYGPVYRPVYGPVYGPAHRPYAGHWHAHRDAWIPGLIVGGALAYALTRPAVVAPPAPIVLAPPAPIAYVERPAVLPPPAAAPAPAAWWYWCPDARGYYPHVPACPTGWQRVPAQPM